MDSVQKKATAMTVIGLLAIANYQYLEPLIRPNYQFDSSFENYHEITPLGIFFWSLAFFFTVFMASIAIYITNLTQMNTFEITFHYALNLILINSIIYQISSYHTETYKMYYCLIISSIIHAIG